MNSVIFLFSLPRSGSTLLQRILMSHKSIASVAEPWLMLPFCYAYKKEGVLTEYSHAICYTAFEDFINNLPNKERDYYIALNNLASSLYEKQCLNNEKYFLDKTPRYYNIIPEIAKIFPNAKFIFLFRNPVHIMSSMINTWCKGRLRCLYAYHRDLNEGLKLLSEGYELLKDKAYAVRYEDFVNNPEKFTKEICQYLEIEFDKDMLVNFINQDRKGRMGDSTGVKLYKKVDNSTLQKWKKTFNNSFRKKYLKKYIGSINGKTLGAQGYNKKNILEEIEKLKVKKGIFFQDRIDVIYAFLIRILKPNIWFGKTTKIWARDRFLG